MFVPLSHAPGEAQAHFGEVVAIVAGLEQTVHFMVFDLPTAMIVLCRDFPPKRPRHFSKVTCGPSSILMAEIALTQYSP
jgi:hypothetical protein